VSSSVFISYASIDQDVAETICDALQARGHPCWIACRDIGPGENFQESIVRAIRAARVMLLVFTSNANNSDEIKKELVLAGRYRVTVLPLRVEDVVPNDAFAYEFATRQWIDLFKDWEREIDRLGAQIDAIIASPKGGESVEPVIATKSAPRPASIEKSSRKSLSAPLVTAAVLILAALGAGGIFLYKRAGPVPGATTAPPPTSPLPAPSSSLPANAAANAPAPSLSPAVSTPVPATTLPAVPPQSPSQASTSVAPHGFDGTWETTITCPPALGALAVTMRFNAQVKDGLFHGQRGTDGQPGWLTLDGKIHPDGVADLYADGLVGAAAFAVGNASKGTPYSYHATGKLAGSSGSGKRIEGRPCTIDFEKLAP